jgi:glycine/D-amino acid oxidase-like deaminating enzyme
MGYKRSVGDLPATANVVIIGAGFAGTATAWALKRLGITDTIVLEREVQLGRFASGRSAGLGRQLAEDEDTTALTVRGAALLRTMPVWAPTGGMLSFDVKGGGAKAERVMLNTKLFAMAESLGGVESLMEHPETMSHASMTLEMRRGAGITDKTLRVSVGIEHPDDLIADMRRALEA